MQCVSPNEDDEVIVLADGLGSGVKANILSTLTSKIISTMVAGGMSIEDCVATICGDAPRLQGPQRRLLHIHDPPHPRQR